MNLALKWARPNYQTKATVGFLIFPPISNTPLFILGSHDTMFSDFFSCGAGWRPVRQLRRYPSTLDVFVCPMDTWKATQLAPFLFRSTCNGPHVVVFAFCDTCREDTDGSYGCFQKLGLANVVWWFFIIYNPYGSKHILRRYIIPPKSYPKHFLRKHGWIHRE